MPEGENIFGSLGIVREAGGNNPVLLDRGDRVWVVEQGHVDVFSVGVKDGEPVGAREHVFRAGSGDLLFGIDLAGGEFERGLLAVGIVGTMLREIERAEFLEFVGYGANAEVIRDLVAGWVRNVSLGIGRREILPRKLQDLAPGGSASVENGTNMWPTARMVWVSVDEGRAAFMGRRDWPEVSDGRLFPLVERAWLQALGESAFVAREEGPALDGDELWGALDAFYGFALACVVANSRRAESTERERMARRVETEQSTLDRALSALAFILLPRKPKVEVEVSEGEPLLAACRMVGRAAGIEVRSSRGGRSDDEQEELLDDIARASGVRTRQVLLRGDWWRRDNGPLLVYREEDDRPMAAVPVSTRRYEVLDPIEGTVTLVTQEAAESLAARAYVFYRPLPDRPLKGMDLIRLGVRGCWGDLGMMLVVGLCGALLGLLTPWMTGLLFDAIIPEAERGQLAQMAAILVACALAVAMFDVTRGIALLRVEGRMDSSIQAALWDRLLALPVPFFRDYTAGDLAMRSMGINTIRMILSGFAVNTVLACLFSSANLLLLFHYSRNLAWIGIGLSVIGVALVCTLSYLQLRYQKRMIAIEGRNAGVVLQFISGIAKLRISGTEDRAFSVWARSFAEKRRLAFKAGTVQNVLASTSSVFPVLALMVLFIWLIWRLDGGLSPGRFIAFNAAYSVFQNAMLQMAMAVTMSLNIFPIYDRLRPIVEAVPEADDTKDKPGELSGRIEVNHVHFRYDPEGPLVLKDVSMSVEPGEFVALVGASGSGKSTLLRLLLGFEAPGSGGVYYDGQDLATLDVREVRRQTGVVLQNGQLMQGDIRTAILGASNLTLDDAWEAARMVGLDQDIKEMPMGMHTMIPAGGGTLSGGQRQRMIIARAIVRKPRILFFDEATSALDNRTQAIVSRSLEGLHVSRVVIAHRLSTIMNADRIYVMDQGEVVECGTYDELMDRDGLFAELARRQIA